MASRRKRKKQSRAMYTRTTGDLLTGGVVPSGVDPASLWWVNSDQLIIGQRDAKLAAVTRATSLITNTVTSMPWRRLSGGPAANRSITDLPTPRWIDDPQLVRNDDRFSGSTVPGAHRKPRAAFWSQWVRNALLRGMGFLLAEIDSTGAPIAGSMRILDNDSVRPHLREDGVLVRRIGSGAEYLETDYDGQMVVGGRTYRLVELSNPTSHRDEYCMAKGVLEMHAAEIGLATKAVNYADGQYEGSGAISGYLKTSTPNFTAEQAEAVRDRWLAHHNGDRRSIAILNAQWEYVADRGFSPLDMAVIESRKFSLIDVANAFGVPSYLLGGADGGSNTYSNAESRNRDFLTFTMLPWATAIEESLSALLPQGQYLSVNFNSLLRPDTATRVAMYSQALKDGWLTVDEVRLTEALPPIDQPIQGDAATQARDLTVAETVQKVYLGVGSVLTSDEARQIVNNAGGDLDPGNPERPRITQEVRRP